MSDSNRPDRRCFEGYGYRVANGITTIRGAHESPHQQNMKTIAALDLNAKRDSVQMNPLSRQVIQPLIATDIHMAVHENLPRPLML